MLRNLIYLAKEHATRLIYTGVQGMRFHQTQQLLMERLIITGRLAGQNHKIGLKAPQPPIGVSEQYFPDQIQALRITGENSHEWEISRDAESPQS